jgi:hypothetical protein
MLSMEVYLQRNLFKMLSMEVYLQRNLFKMLSMGVYLRRNLFKILLMGVYLIICRCRRPPTEVRRQGNFFVRG